MKQFVFLILLRILRSRLLVLIIDFDIVENS